MIFFNPLSRIKAPSSIECVHIEVQPEEQKVLCAEIMENEETAMLAQCIKELGRVEGRVEGLLEGRQAILQRLVTKRFGQNILGFHLQEQLRKATPEQLDLWAERILDAESVDEVFKDN